jgi:hypothetical protein
MIPPDNPTARGLAIRGVCEISFRQALAGQVLAALMPKLSASLPLTLPAQATALVELSVNVADSLIVALAGDEQALNTPPF